MFLFDNLSVHKKGIRRVLCLLCAVLLLTISFPYTAGAASVSILQAGDGSNYLASDAAAVDSYTQRGAVITLVGVVMPVQSEVAVRVNAADDASKCVYIRQAKSDVHGKFIFNFSTASFEAGTYEITVGAEGGTEGKKRYFKIARPEAPLGAEKVFSCFTVNGRRVSFDSTKYAFAAIPREEIDIMPVLDIAAADKTAKVTVNPEKLSKVPCAVKVSVEYTDGTSDVYSLLLDGEGEKRISDLQTAPPAGKCEVEYDIKLGTSTDNASLVYNDRTNVFWSSQSSGIFGGATQIKRAKNDAGGFVGDDYNGTGKFANVRKRAYYGGAYSGRNGEPYWMSFKVHADATVYMADGHKIGWPNNDGTWKNDSNFAVKHGGGGATANGTNLYYKEFLAGETVNIPNYGMKEGWPEGNTVLYDPPAFVIVWKGNGKISGTDASLTGITYSCDGGEKKDIENFSAENGSYVIKVPEGTNSVTLGVQKSDSNASAEGVSEPIILSDTVTVKPVRVVSAGGIIERTYTVTIRKDSGNIVWGDVDGDGHVTGTDAIWILRNEIGLSVPEGCDINAGDVDGDGLVTGTDAIWILRNEIGLSVPPTVRIG